MEEMIFCQSCGMPLENDEMKGSEADGTKSEDYCNYCYQNGKFEHDITMEEMIEINLKYIDQWEQKTGEKMSVDEAREQLMTFMPQLKRWRR